MNIGWVGLGNMGIPMLTNLLKAGNTIYVYNRTKSKIEGLLEQGVIAVDQPSDLFLSCDIVVTMVSDNEAVREVYLGENGIYTKADAGKIAIDMSTVSPKISREIYVAGKEIGVHFLDAPVSGSVLPAKEGKLIIMVGGEEDVFQRVKPIFDTLGKLTLYLGPSGSGSNAKLAINLLLGITVQGIAESILFAEKQGIRREDMLNIILESAVGTPIARIKAASILNNEFPAAFALKHMAKDLRLAGEIEALTPLGESINKTYQAALENGLGDLDVMAVLEFLMEENK